MKRKVAGWVAVVTLLAAGIFAKHDLDIDSIVRPKAIAVVENALIETGQLDTLPDN